MQLTTEDVDIDMYDVNQRSLQWENVRTGMKMGLITPENFHWEDRNAVRLFFGQLPIVEPVDPRLGLARVVGIVNLREGWDWCFATSRGGTFGVFTLDEPGRTLLEGATFHLWPGDTIIGPTSEDRIDFMDLAEYQDAALEASLAA